MKTPAMAGLILAKKSFRGILGALINPRTWNLSVFAPQDANRELFNL
jgi:hypothetical protein